MARSYCSEIMVVSKKGWRLSAYEPLVMSLSASVRAINGLITWPITIRASTPRLSAVSSVQCVCNTNNTGLGSTIHKTCSASFRQGDILTSVCRLSQSDVDQLEAYDR